MREIWTAIGINAALLCLILGIVRLWQQRRPMTDSKLRRQVILTDTDEAPFGGDFCRMRTMLGVLEGEPVSAARTLTALVLDWAQQGSVSLTYTEKKPLKSFGAPQQATLCFPADEDGKCAPPQEDGAAGLLLGMLCGWLDGEDTTLQESELYTHARKNHRTVHDRLEQLDTQGRHGLRTAGEGLPEKQRRYLGLVEDGRPLYTPRGVREAGKLLGYQARLGTQAAPAQWRDAALCGQTQGIDGAQLALAEAIARAIANGAAAGKQSKKI